MTPAAFLMTGAGLALLFFGGEFLLRGAVAIALRSGLSPLLIGLTVVACATSMPELLVTVAAGLEGVPDVGVGNVIGSNIANILLILGVSAVLKPIAANPKLVTRDTFVMIAATALFILFAFMGRIGPIEGGIMLAALTLYIYASYRQERRNGPRSENDILEEVGGKTVSGPVSAGLILLGLAGLVVGSELLIEGAVDLARAAGVSDTVIGLTLVAVGTSLPELATAVVAGMRGHSDVALGNVVGSNIFNLLLIIGVLAMIAPFNVAPEVLNFDIWALAAISLALLPIIMMGRKIGRGTGVVFLVIYVAFIAYQFLSGSLSPGAI